MLYNIQNKKVNILIEDIPFELPKDLQEKISENFEKMRTSGKNIWNGNLLCVSGINITSDTVTLTCKKSTYAHYLYGENIGCPTKYECRNLSAGCFLETIDGYFVLGELADTTSFPHVLQTTGGGIDKADIFNNQIRVEQTIIREAFEELNIDLTDRNIVSYNELSYLFVSEKDEQPGVQVFSKAILTMTAEAFQKYFEKYYNYLVTNQLEIEFKKLHFLKKENAISTLEKLNKPYRAYLKPLILANSKELADNNTR